jgi:hypothetical protein
MASELAGSRRSARAASGQLTRNINSAASAYSAAVLQHLALLFSHIKVSSPIIEAGACCAPSAHHSRGSSDSSPMIGRVAVEPRPPPPARAPRSTEPLRTCRPADGMQKHRQVHCGRDCGLPRAGSRVALRWPGLGLPSASTRARGWWQAGVTMVQLSGTAQPHPPIPQVTHHG